MGPIFFDVKTLNLEPRNFVHRKLGVDTPFASQWR